MTHNCETSPPHQNWQRGARTVTFPFTDAKKQETILSWGSSSGYSATLVTQHPQMERHITDTPKTTPTKHNSRPSAYHGTSYICCGYYTQHFSDVCVPHTFKADFSAAVISPARCHCISPGITHTKPFLWLLQPRVFTKLSKVWLVSKMVNKNMCVLSQGLPLIARQSGGNKRGRYLSWHFASKHCPGPLCTLPHAQKQFSSPCTLSPLLKSQACKSQKGCQRWDLSAKWRD